MNRLSPAGGHTLALICEALLPVNDSVWRASVVERAMETLSQLPDPDDLTRLDRFLRLMRTAPAALLLTGRWQRFPLLDRAGRQEYLRALAAHRLTAVRGAFQALKRLITVEYYAATDAAGHNPVWPGLGYPGPIAPSPDVPKPIQPLRVERSTSLECDVAVIGSGAGGGMAAVELAAAGLEVLVLEKGGYHNESDFTQLEAPMLRHLYLGGGSIATRDQGMLILAGSCLGGGTVVNYTTSFRTPDAVRDEWARVSGLDLFTGDDFTRSLDAAWARLHANLEHNRPSARDAVMARGLEALGWHVDRMPRDVQGCTQDDVCGYCGLGCVRGAKCSTLKTCLQEAHQRGAGILPRCTAEKIRIENGKAVGVQARTDAGVPVSIRARAVVVAGGAVESPALLLRSGLTAPVGEHLHLHPATGVLGRFDDEVRPWTGTLQALYSDQFADLDGGYGVKLETAPMHPTLAALAVPWESPDQFDAGMRDLPHTALVGVLLRDRGAGRITLNRHGQPVADYRLSSYDAAHLRRGVEAAGRVLLAAGAREISSAQSRPATLQSGRSGSVERWMERVDGVGYASNQMLYVTFHQMGTCRMGSDPRTSVVNGRGETHQVRDLFVADASLFPTASGVNPMLTVAALGHYVAGQVQAAL